MPDFSIGNYVRVIFPSDPCEGHVGIVVERKGMVTCVRCLDCDRTTSWRFKTSLETPPGIAVLGGDYY